MKRTLTPLLCLSVAIVLSACNRLGGGAGAASSSALSSQDIPETRNVTYRGTVEGLGATIYMQGTHALALGDGRMLILESSAVDLEIYLDHEVEVFGSLRPTVEAGGIIMRVERITDLSPQSSASSMRSSTSSRSSSPLLSSATTSAASSVSVAATSRSSAVSVASSVRSSAASSAAQSSVPVSTDAALEARIALMAKQDMSGRNWTQQYCSDHVGFCVPVHRNWWFVSFGNTTRTLWHVEVSSESFEAMGSGPVTVDLIGGDLSGHADGEVAVSGAVATGYRSWTQGRHIEIRADARLEAAVRYMTENLRSTESST